MLVETEREQSHADELLEKLEGAFFEHDYETFLETLVLISRFM